MSRGLPLRAAALRIPVAIHEALQLSPRGISEEARLRIERTFREDAIDPRTRNLAEAIVRLAEEVATRVGAQWHENERAYDTFVAAIANRMATLRPAESSQNRALLIDPEDDTKTIGRMLDRDDARKQAELASPDLTDEIAPRVGRLARIVEGMDKTAIPPPPTTLQPAENSPLSAKQLDEEVKRLRYAVELIKPKPISS